MIYYPNMVESDTRIYQKPISQLKCIVFNGADNTIKDIQGLSNRSLVLRYNDTGLDGQSPIEYLDGGYNQIEVDGDPTTLYIVVTSENDILSEQMFDVVYHYVLINSIDFGYQSDMDTLNCTNYYAILSEYDYSIVSQVISELYLLMRAVGKVSRGTDLNPEVIQLKIDESYLEYNRVIDSNAIYDEDEDLDFPTNAEIDDEFSFDIEDGELFKDLVQDIDDTEFNDTTRLLSEVGYRNDESDDNEYEQGLLFRGDDDDMIIDVNDHDEKKVDDLLKVGPLTTSMVKMYLRLSSRVYEYNKIVLNSDVDDIVKVERMNEMNRNLQELFKDYSLFVSDLYHQKPRVGMDTWTAYSDFDMDEIHWIRKIEVKDLEDISFIEDDMRYFHRIHPVLLIDIDNKEMVDRLDDIRFLMERSFQLLNRVEHSISNELIK